MANEVKVKITAQNEAGSALKECQAQLEQLASAAQALGVVLSLREIVEGVNHINELGGSLVRLSSTTNLTVEQLSSLRFAANQNGQDFGTLTSALNTFARLTLTALETGTGKAAIAFKALGINVLDSNGKTKQTGQLLEEVAKKLLTLPPGLERSGTAAQLFGRQGATLLPTLADLASGFAELEKDADSAGALISGQTAAQLEEAEQATKRLQSGVEGLAVQFVAGLDPSLEKVIGALTSTRGEMGDLQSVGAGLGEAIVWLTKMFLSFTHAVNADLFETNANIYGMMADLESFLGKYDFTEGLRKHHAELAQSYRDLANVYHFESQQIVEDYGKVNDALTAAPKAASQKKKPNLSDVDLEGIGKAQKDQTKQIEEAKLRLREAGEAAQVTVAKAYEKQQIAALDLEKEQGLLTLGDYYAKRLAIQKTAIEAEIAATKEKLTAALATADSPKTDQVGKLKAETEATNAIAKLMALRSDLAAVVAEDQTRELKGEQELRDFKIATEAEIRSAKGQTLQVAIEAIQREYDEKKNKARSMGMSGSDVSGLDAVAKQKIAAVTAQNVAEQIQEVYSQLDEQTQQLQSAVQHYGITSMDAEKQLNVYRDESIKKLQLLVAQYRTLAQAAGDPKMITDANHQATQLGQLSDKKKQQLQQAVGTELTTGFDTFFQTLQQSGSAAKAFNAMANSIISDIERMVTKLMVQMLIQKAMGMFTGVMGESAAQSSAMAEASNPGDPLGIFQGSSFSLPALAGGGSLAANQPAIVGEDGPELWVPNNAGQVVPGSASGGHGPMNIQITSINNGTPKNVQTATPQYNEMTKTLHLQLHLDDMVNNGPLSRGMYGNS